MVPMLTCGLFRSNFSFATGCLLDVQSYLGSSPASVRRRQRTGYVSADYSPPTFATLSWATAHATSASETHPIADLARALLRLRTAPPSPSIFDRGETPSLL